MAQQRPQRNRKIYKLCRRSTKSGRCNSFSGELPRWKVRQLNPRWQDGIRYS